MALTDFLRPIAALRESLSSNSYSLPPQQYEVQPYQQRQARQIQGTAQPSSDPAFDQFIAEQRALLSSLNSTNRSLSGLQNPAPSKLPTLPNFSIEDTFNRARQAATSTVSPYYETLLQSFKDQQGKKRTRAEEDVASLEQNVAEDFKTLQSRNEQERKRTEEDVTRNLDTIGATGQALQEGGADAFSRAFKSLRGQQAQGNLTFSGIGAQEQESALQDKARTEGQQTAELNRQKQTQKIFKERTFQDIAQSEDLAQKSGERQTKRAKKELERTFSDLADELVQQERTLEMQKQSAISENEGLQAKNQFSNFLSQLRSPEEVAYANQLYGGIF